MTKQTIFNRTWCRDCYDRREPWVLRLLEEHGVAFERTVLRRDDTCHACRDVLPANTAAVAVRYPGPAGADRARDVPVPAGPAVPATGEHRGADRHGSEPRA